MNTMKKMIAVAGIAAALFSGSAAVAAADTGSSARDTSTSKAVGKPKAAAKSFSLPSPSDICAGIKRLFNQSPSVGRSGR